jgi:OmpA-OmpF porin, OOP family
MKRHYLAFSALALVAAIAPATAMADGWYWGLMLGASNYNSSNDGRDSAVQQGFPALSASDNPVAGGISFGYHLNPNFALEFGYLDLGQAQSTVGDLPAGSGNTQNQVDAGGLTLEAIGAIPLGDSVALFAKGGGFFYSVDSSVYGPDFPQYDSVSRSTYDLGVGASFALNEFASLRVGYTRFHSVGDPAFFGEGPVGLTYAQLIFNFWGY